MSNDMSLQYLFWVSFDEDGREKIGGLRFEGETPIFEGDMTAAEFQEHLLASVQYRYPALQSAPDAPGPSS